MHSFFEFMSAVNEETEHPEHKGHQDGLPAAEGDTVAGVCVCVCKETVVANTKYCTMHEEDKKK